MDRVSRTQASVKRERTGGAWTAAGRGSGGHDWAHSDHGDARTPAPRQPLFQRYGSGGHDVQFVGSHAPSGHAGARRPRPGGAVSWTAADGSLAVREVTVTRHQRSPDVQLVGPGGQRMPALGGRFVPQHLLGVGSFSQLLRCVRLPRVEVSPSCATLTAVGHGLQGAGCVHGDGRGHQGRQRAVHRRGVPGVYAATAPAAVPWRGGSAK